MVDSKVRKINSEKILLNDGYKMYLEVKAV
jgi:hypothetical protein